MKLQKNIFNLGLILASISLGMGLSQPASAQILVNYDSSDNVWSPIKKMVFNHLVQGYKDNNFPLSRNAKVEISSLMMAGDWLTATYLITSRENPHGVAGQLLFKKEDERWFFKGEGNYIRDVNTLMDFGVPRSEAESLADGPDI